MIGGAGLHERFSINFANLGKSQMSILKLPPLTVPPKKSIHSNINFDLGDSPAQNLGGEFYICR
jgi:hypothetical protein